MPVRPRHCNGICHARSHMRDSRFTQYATDLRVGKASDASRSQETTRAHTRTKTLEGGALYMRTRWVLRALVGLVPLVGMLACSRADSTATPPRDALPVVRVPRAAATAAGSASDATAPVAPADTDDFGAPLPVDARFAARVVSLNPAATEALFAIGADSLLVGRSRWDEYPSAVSRIAALGDGIRPNIEVVLAARPTLVLLYATAENRAAADALARAGVRTVALRVDRIAHFYRLLHVLGRAVGAQPRANTVRDSVHATLSRVRALTTSLPRPRVVWPAWESPLLVIGGGSYLDELLTIAGAENVFHDISAPSPPVSIEEIAKRNPDMVVTSANRVASLRTSPSWQAVGAVRAQRFVVHDPTVTGRPSVVLGMAAVQLARALHPELRESLK